MGQTTSGSHLIRKFFYVYQNKTYHEERNGGFLWSPKYASGWRINAGYETMKQVRPGDVIFHSYNGCIVAVSIAQSSCYTHERPSGAFAEWAKDGWMIDTVYYVFPKSLKVADYIPNLYKIQPANGPYAKNYKGKQQYLCNSNIRIFEFLIKEIISIQKNPRVEKEIKNFLSIQNIQNNLKTQNIQNNFRTTNENREVVKEENGCVSNFSSVVDGCLLYVNVLEQRISTKFHIDINKYQYQKTLIGKKVGNTFKVPGKTLTYRIEKIEYNKGDQS